MNKDSASNSSFVAPFRYVETVKRHFLECELKTADGLISDYVEYVEEMDICDAGASATRQKLIWLLERLQESVL